MTPGDVRDVGTLDLGGSRGPAGWVDWQRDNYAEHGFGLWVVETHDGEFVGDCGLTMQEIDDEGHVETGWHVRRDLRRRGFASEAALAVRDAALASGIGHLVAIIRPDNHASQGVARKIGMTLLKETEKSGQRVLVFGTPLELT
jgi:RimJ/RimL family protein N-acetyltransferase